VDTLHRFLDGDENSAQDAKTMLDACNALMAEFGCTVILVHHTGVSDEAQHRARGSSAWRGALDIEISIVPAKGENPIEIVQRKSKDAELAPTIYVNLESQDIDGWIDEDGDQVSSAVISAAEKVEKQSKATHANCKTFENMWHDSGKELMAGSPFVSNAFARSVFESQGHSKNVSKRYSLGTQDNGPLAQLRSAGLLRKDTAGWIVDDNIWQSAMLMGTK
jgi:putative DNA primase/helicase